MTVTFEDVHEDVMEAGEGAEAEPGPDPAPVVYRALSQKAKKKIARRRSSEVRAYIGPNGSGKSALMCMDLLPVLEGQVWRCTNPDHLHTQRGQFEGIRRVLSTMPLLDSATGRPHELYDKLTDWVQVLEAEHTEIAFDEVTGIAGSRESMGMPVVVQNKLNQMRRSDTPVSWSAPSWARADSIIRSCTKLVTDCRGWMPDRSVLRSDAPPAWVPRRLFKARSFAATDFDEWTAAKASQQKGAINPLRAQVVQWWWGPGSLVFGSYDTHGAVSRVGDVLDGGRCAHCGGRRAVPACRCE